MSKKEPEREEDDDGALLDDRTTSDEPLIGAGGGGGGGWCRSRGIECGEEKEVDVVVDVGKLAGGGGESERGDGEDMTEGFRTVLMTVVVLLVTI